jgi:hypothetical protein
MRASLQIKIVTLLGYVILSTALVVMGDDSTPRAGFSRSTAARHQAAQSAAQSAAQ